MLLLLALDMLYSCQSNQKQNQDLSLGFEFEKDTLLQFIKNNDTLTPVFEIELAQSDYEKETGLMHRKTMKPNQGMLFVYTTEKSRPTFYMKNTYIPLDLIYLNSKKEIVDFNLNTTPLSEDWISSNIPSTYVLEVNAGTVETLNLKLGDFIVLN
mgnify:CR=1 FL=1